MAVASSRERVITTPAVVLSNPKYRQNLAGIVRACSCFGIPTLLWTGNRIDLNEMDRLPREERMKGYRDVYWEKLENNRPFDLFPGAVPVCVELVPHAENLASFDHPERAVYVFGPEDGSVPQVFRMHCHRFVFIPSAHCLNLSAAVNVVLYDRRVKRISQGLESPVMAEILQETRGGNIDVPGWDGK